MGDPILNTVLSISQYIILGSLLPLDKKLSTDPCTTVKDLFFRVHLHLIQSIKTISSLGKLEAFCMGLFAHIKVKKI